MPRLIDAEELIEVAHRERLDSRERIERMIESAPTVDAVPVVRCKDCIYYGDHGDGEIVCAMMILYPNKPTDYCSLGERR